MKRATAAACAAGTIVLGLASRRVHLGASLIDKSAGDALYTVMVYFLVALVRPDAPPVKLGAWALGTSLAIETFQLTGIPLRMPRILHLVFGTTFSWHDVACYVVGAAVITAAHGFIRWEARAA